MRKRNFLVKRFAKDVQIENQDLRNEFALTHRAEREMMTMKNRFLALSLSSAPGLG